MRTISTKKECEDAAKVLGLLDTSAYELQDPARPHGCHYADNDWLGIASPEGHPYANIPCGSTDHKRDYECICSRSGNNKNFVDKCKKHIFLILYNIT